MIKKTLLLFSLLLLFFISRIDFTSSIDSKEYVKEEAIPIWNEEQIERLDYSITITKEEKENNFSISTHIIDSILHYKDINNIEQIEVHIILDNQSQYEYLLQRLYIYEEETNRIIQIIAYEQNSKIISFTLEKELLERSSLKHRIKLDFIKK